VNDLGELAYRNGVNSSPTAHVGRLLRRGFAYLPQSRTAAERTTRTLPVDAASSKISTSVAQSATEAALARELVRKRYYRAGYRMVEDDGIEFPSTTRAAFYRPIIAVSAQSAVVGTVTLGIDSHAGLMVDDANRTIADAIRAEGGRLCELVRLALEDGVDAHKVLAALLHRAYAISVHSYNWTDLLIEVIPQHVSFYRRVFGFAPTSDIRLCERVGGVASLVLRLRRLELERRLYLRH
jgi:hypothetical protein